MKINDIIGNNLILEKDKEKSKEKHHTYYKVQCILCGNIRSIRGDNIYQSCASCAAKNRKNPNIVKDLTGQNFGYWTVLNKANKPNYWHCKCKCGTEKDVFRGSLTQGTSKSCGCNSSWGETKIIKILQDNNIKYKKEYTFKDLKTEKDGFPRFDFALFDEKDNIICLIEYNGRQHYYYDNNWKMSYIDFQRLQKIDLLKEEYCQKHNLLLYKLNETSDLESLILSIISNSNKGLTK